MDVCVTVLLRGCQVALQFPSFNENSDSGGSPFEKLAVTDPAVIRLPQSSTTFAVTAVGHAAGMLKSCKTELTSGSSLLGVQPAVRLAKSSVAAVDPGPPAVSTSRILTFRIDPSVNSSVSTPRRTPAVRLSITGCTTMVAA